VRIWCAYVAIRLVPESRARRRFDRPTSVMIRRTTLPLALAGLLWLAFGCSRGVIGGKPTAPLSDSKGTSSNYVASEEQVLVAITNSFPTPHWVLDRAAESAYLVPGWHATNGLVLFSIDQTITNIQLNDPAGTWVPYVAYFHIELQPAGSGITRVTVRTIKSDVIDGKEPGIHGGWADHHRAVPPVRQEEENILRRICDQLNRKGPRISIDPEPGSSVGIRNGMRMCATITRRLMRPRISWRKCTRKLLGLTKRS